MRMRRVNSQKTLRPRPLLNLRRSWRAAEARVRRNGTAGKIGDGSTVRPSRRASKKSRPLCWSPQRNRNRRSRRPRINRQSTNIESTRARRWGMATTQHRSVAASNSRTPQKLNSARAPVHASSKSSTIMTTLTGWTRTATSFSHCFRTTDDPRAFTLFKRSLAPKTSKLSLPMLIYQ